jgi:serine/threonine protein kinase
VAIKFLKVHAGGSRRKALDCLHREIKILAECEHPNIAKIIEASFEGIIVKESMTNESVAKQNDPKDDEQSMQSQSEKADRVKRKTNVCYYVMKLAEYGEIFRFIEHTDRFSERLARTLFG